MGLVMVMAFVPFILATAVLGGAAGFAVGLVRRSALAPVLALAWTVLGGALGVIAVCAGFASSDREGPGEIPAWYGRDWIKDMPLLWGVALGMLGLAGVIMATAYLVTRRRAKLHPPARGPLRPDGPL